MANTTDKLSQLMALAARLNVYASPVTGKDGAVSGLTIDFNCPAYLSNLPVLTEIIQDPRRVAAPAPSANLQ